MIDTKEFARKYFVFQQKLNRRNGRKAPELSKGEMAMLGYFVCEKSESTPTELSEQFHLSTARVANTLNSLEKKGYVKRVHDTVDRRRVSVILTEDGKQYFLQVEAHAIADFEKLLQVVGKEDAEQLLRIITKLSNALT